jgi:DNA-binding PadR family transcriptional regulator
MKQPKRQVPKRQAPLTPAVFHILLALFGRERHGYDIMQQVRSDSRNVIKMGPGTLYGSLERMIEAGLVAKSNTRDPRRIFYKLTALGEKTLRAEIDRLSRLVTVAKRHLENERS